VGKEIPAKTSFENHNEAKHPLLKCDETQEFIRSSQPPLIIETYERELRRRPKKSKKNVLYAPVSLLGSIVIDVMEFF